MNGEKLLIRALQLYGVDQPEGYVKAAEQQVPASQVQGFLAQLGVPPEAFVQFLDAQQQGGDGGPPMDGPPEMGGPTVNGAMGAAMGGEH
jgi:hypothetical protein